MLKVNLFASGFKALTVRVENCEREFIIQSSKSFNNDIKILQSTDDIGNEVEEHEGYKIKEIIMSLYMAFITKIAKLNLKLR